MSVHLAGNGTAKKEGSMKNISKHIRSAAQKAALMLLMFCLTAALLPNTMAKAAAAMPSSLMLNIGETRSVTTETGGTNYIWSCSDASVLDVQGNGARATFRGLRAGTATVTAACTRQKPDLMWNPVTEQYDHTTVPYQTTDTCVVLVVDPDAPTPPAETNPSKGKVGENVAGTLEDIGGFGGGLVPVKRGGLWGYANGKLQLAIPFQYDYASEFSEGGIAYVRTGKSKCVIDQKGKVIYRDSGIGYQALIYPHHTFFTVQRYYTKNNWKWENYDLNGNATGKGEQDADDRLRAGWGDLDYWNTDSGSMYYNDGGENWLFGRPGDYSYDYDNPALKIPIVPGIEHPSIYGDGSHAVIQEGLLVVRATAGKWGALDKTGKLVIPCEYDTLYDSRGGFLAYRKGSAYGLLKNPVQPPKAVADIAPEKTEGTGAIPRVTLLSLKSKAKGKATVTWKRVACDGYQIAYTRDVSFSIEKTQLIGAGSSASKKTLKGLTKGKTYYVRVRAYRTADGKTSYGAWSRVKKVKIKK